MTLRELYSNLEDSYGTKWSSFELTATNLLNQLMDSHSDKLIMVTMLFVSSIG